MVFSVMFYSLALLSTCFLPHVIAQNRDVKTVKLSVSPMQQKNYDVFIASIKKHESLKTNNGFIQLLQNMFEAMKQNEYNKYISLLKQFSSDYKKLSQNEKDSYQQIIWSLPYPNPTDTGLPIEKPPTQSCYVACSLGSCSITCNGSPTCTCDMGYPQCICGIGQ